MHHTHKRSGLSSIHMLICNRLAATCLPRPSPPSTATTKHGGRLCLWRNTYLPFSPGSVNTCNTHKHNRYSNNTTATADFKQYRQYIHRQNKEKLKSHNEKSYHCYRLKKNTCGEQHTAAHPQENRKHTEVCSKATHFP